MSYYIMHKVTVSGGVREGGGKQEEGQGQGGRERECVCVC